MLFCLLEGSGVCNFVNRLYSACMRNLLFIFLFCFSVSFGQHKIGVSNAFAWSNFVDTEKNVDNKFLFGYTGKVYYEYEMQFDLAFYAGVSYQQRGYKFENGETVVNGVQYDLRVKYRTQQITIPIGARYYFFKNDYMFVGMELQPGFRLSDKRIGPEWGWGFQPDAKRKYAPKDKFDFSMQVEFAPLGYNMHFGTTGILSLYLSVYFQYSFTKIKPHIELNDRELNIYTIGLNVIGNLSFFKRK